MPESAVVLKFGGSVLRKESDVDAATHEVYRWARHGHRVVVVVSALAGTTDRLAAEPIECSPAEADADHTADDACDQRVRAMAARLAEGELETAALLCLALDRMGLATEMLDPRQMDLRTTGPLMDASPVSVNCNILRGNREGRSHGSVVVVPGFVGVDQRHDCLSLLGRGGSDCTAVFLAHQLGASHCRLIKDVDGVYEWDPLATDAPPRRFCRLAWNDAVDRQNGVLQRKAVEYARDHQQPFDVAAMHRNHTTRIDQGPTALAEDNGQPDVHLLSPCRVALLGFGTVGAGVYDAVSTLPEIFNVTAVLVRNRFLADRDLLPDDLLITCQDKAIDRQTDVVVEALGGVEPARSLIACALERGKDVVTANKTVIAEHGVELQQLADRYGGRLRYAAAVGGAAPLVEAVSHVAAGPGVASIDAVLNGTTNFVLDRVSDGCSMSDSVREAQDRGFAEQDPSRDLDGRDAADKLAIMCRHAWPVEITPDDIRRADLENMGNGIIRQVASAHFDGVAVNAEVRPMSLTTTHPLAAAEEEWNIAVIQTCTGEQRVVRGRGAGRLPTTQAVVADLLDLVRLRAASMLPDSTTKQQLD